MQDKIVLELNAGEAIVTYGRLEGAAADAFKAWRELILTSAPKDEEEAAKLVAQILARVTARLQEALYPPCEWFRDECDRPRVDGERYCQYHLDRIVAQKARVA